MRHPSIPAILTLASCLLSVAVALAAPGDHLWSQTFSASVRTAGDGADGAVLAATFTGSTDFGGGPVTAGNSLFGDGVVAHYGSDGSLLWLQQFTPIAGGLAINAVATDGSGAVYIGGVLYLGSVNFGGNLLTGSSQVFLVKYHADGQHAWSGLFGELDLKSLSTAGDRLAIVGTNFGLVDFGGGALEAAGAGDIYVAVLDTAGQHVWSAQWGDDQYQEGVGGGLDAAGNLVLAVSVQGEADFGENVLVATATDLGLVGLDNSGVYRWGSLFDGTFAPFGSIPVTCAVAPDGTSALVGFLSGAGDLGGGSIVAHGAGDVFVAVFETTGQHRWSVALGGSDDDYGEAVSIDNAGNVAVSGSVVGPVDLGGGSLTGPGLRDLFLAIYDPAGDHLYSQVLGSPGYDGYLFVDLGAAGNLVVGGFAQAGFDLGGGVFQANRSFVGQLQGLGGFVAVGELPDAAAPRLRSVFPNPFNPATQIRFAMPVVGPARLTILDAAGRQVARLLDEIVGAGEHGVTWHGVDKRGAPVSSGTYLVVLETDSGREARKISLLK